jgi:hypothetical protein
MSRPNERILVILGLAVIGGLIALTGYLGYRRVAEADAEQAAGATRVAALAPTWTAAAKPAPTSPPPAPPATVAPTIPAAAPTPTAAPAASATPRPTIATPAPTTASTIAATPRPTEEGRYLGRDPLPPGVDLTNGPYLKEMKARGAKGANVGDGGLGDELKAAYLAALKGEEQALNANDPSQVSQFFTGEELERLQAAIEKDRTDTRSLMSVVKYEPLVMEFMPETAVPGVYEVVDARTETISTARRLPDGKPGEVVKPGEPARVCYSVQLIKVNGRWKVQSADAENDGPDGHRCPPYWS